MVAVSSLDLVAYAHRHARSTICAVLDARRSEVFAAFYRAEYVPVILVETGFLTNPAESRRLHSAAYQARVAGGLVAGVTAFVSP